MMTGIVLWQVLSDFGELWSIFPSRWESKILKSRYLAHFLLKHDEI